MVKHKFAKDDLIAIASKHSDIAPMVICFQDYSEEYFRVQLAPMWVDNVCGLSIQEKTQTPYQNAKQRYFGFLEMPFEDGCHINDDVAFCYPYDQPFEPIVGVILNGGLVVIYRNDICWFREPNGFECWARMD